MADARRAGLLAAKLRVLVAEAWPGTDAQPRTFAAGAGLVSATRAWVLVDEQRVDADPLDGGADVEPRLPHGWLGGAWVWARRQGCAGLDVIAETCSALDATRAALLHPAPVLWRSEGRALRAVEPADGAPGPGPQLDARLLSLIPTIEGAGAEVVVEHGVLRAEVLGLEVAVAELDADTGEPVLVVGVGRHDRLAQSMMASGLAPAAALLQAVEAVRAQRRAGATPHPANQLARSRWLRSVLIARPQVVGAVSLGPLAGLEPPRLKVPAPALCLGAAADGRALLVAASAGVDLDAPLELALMRRRIDQGARAVLAVPVADALPSVGLLCESVGVELVTVSDAWSGLA